MPEDAGLELQRELRRRGNLIPFVVLSEIDDEDERHIRAGAVPGDEFHILVDFFHFDLLGYWIHRLDDKYRELLRTDRLKTDMCRTTPQKLAELREAAKTLTLREGQILDMIGAGKSNMEIAGELFISYKTVKNHVSNIFAKLGIHTRAEAIHFVMAMRISGE
jgi:DNA-binding NarL/FixJ family response regulator